MTTQSMLRVLRTCECGEYTYSAECGPCRRPEPAGHAGRTVWRAPAKACGCLVGDDCGCPQGPALATGIAYYRGGRRTR